jgi:iron complex transport system permease protein
MGSRLRNRRVALVSYVALLSLLLVILFLVSIMIGTAGLTVGQVVGSIFGWNQNVTTHDIIFDYRIPRIIFALLTGGILGVAGGVMQSLTRNPLADPYISGMSGGAALGAAIGFTIPLIPVFSVPVFAFVGGVSMLGLSMFIARRAGGGSMSFILAGIAVGTLANAFLMIIISLNPYQAHGIMYWLFGSFTTSSWTAIEVTLIVAVPSLTLIFWWARDLNILIFGEEHATQIGVNAKVLWPLLLVLSCLAVAACVSFCGIIGFIGLVSPHIVRLVVGADNRFVLPLAGLTGALLLLASDDLVRLPVNLLNELPVGSITAMIGVPVFIYLLVRKGKDFGL